MAATILSLMWLNVLASDCPMKPIATIEKIIPISKMARRMFSPFFFVPLRSDKSENLICRIAWLLQ
jgi:hypothetical protein